MNMTNGSRVWFVTGASRGIGRAIVEAAVARGDQVVAVVRSADAARSITEASNANVVAAVADVTRPDDVRSAVDQARRAFGGIDVLVNNAGYTLLGGVEEAADDQIRQQFETNVFGLIDVTRAVLPLLRRSARGFIVTISSVAGVSASAGFAYYAASKHAVEGFAEALAKEIAPLGIRLTIVEPGSFRTDALGSSMISAAPDHTYADSVGRFRELIGSLDGHQPGDPHALAAQVLRLVDEPEPPLHLPLDPGATQPIGSKLTQQLAELHEWAPRYSANPAARPAVIP
jgi:NAD(P)-dependent dehydrogenase (short-subunit alcohol dehydrogenase family)